MSSNPLAFALAAFLPLACPFFLILNENFATLQTAAVLALTEVRSEDKSELSKLISTIKEGYSDKYEESKRHWGGGIMGQKAIARTEKKRKAIESAIKI